MRDYLGEVAVQDQLPRTYFEEPRSYPTASQFGHVEDQLPAVGIHVPGLREEPYKNHDGMFWCKWELEVGILVGADTEMNTDRMVKLYAAAVWGAIMQDPSLGGVAEHTSHLTERYDVLEDSKSRSVAFALLTFAVDVHDARQSYGGPVANQFGQASGDSSGIPDPAAVPPSPVPTDYGEWPTVTGTVVRLDGRTGNNP